MSVMGEFHRLGFTLVDLSDGVKHLIQDRMDKCHNEISNGGYMLYGRLMPPTEKFVQSCYDWCLHDVVNMAAKDVRRYIGNPRNCPEKRENIIKSPLLTP